MTVGIIAEYNPFHNGHIYHLKKIKEMYPDSSIVLVLSTHFTQRGIPSILNKWDKTCISLQYGVDLVIELPFIFSVQSADFFAQGAIEILNAVGVDVLVFGSETGDVKSLSNLAKIELYNPNFSTLVKENLDRGINYPTAMNEALKKLGGTPIDSPNDLLALSYIKEIMKQNSSITPIAIQRTNSYHAEELEDMISSATSIRKAFFENQDISSAVPKEVQDLLKKQSFFLEDYFPYFQYKVYSSPDLSCYLDVDEGIENRILEKIDDCSSFEEFLSKIKTKRYTYNKMNRMIIHILCGFTKSEREYFEHVPYLRILGFSKKGKKVLHDIKKTCPLPILTNFQKNTKGLQIEKRVTSIYAIPLKESERQELIRMEYRKKPIYKEDH